MELIANISGSKHPLFTESAAFRIKHLVSAHLQLQLARMAGKPAHTSSLEKILSRTKELLVGRRQMNRQPHSTCLLAYLFQNDDEVGKS